MALVKKSRVLTFLICSSVLISLEILLVSIFIKPGQLTLTSAQEDSFVVNITLSKSSFNVWLPPSNDSVEFDKFLIYKDELLPSLQSRLIDKTCPENAKLVIIAKSSTTNEKKREAIRRTWATLAAPNEAYVYFALGTTGDAIAMSSMEEEDEENQDLIQWPFVDSYKNLTIKTILALHWAHSCPSLEYLVTTDDDVYLDLKLLTKGLSELNAKFSKSYARKVLLGFGYAPAVFTRNKNSYHYVPSAVQATDGPRYVGGLMQIYGSEALKPLLLATWSSMPALYLEDVFVTGFMADKADVARWSLSEHILHRRCFDSTDAMKTKLVIGDKCSDEYLFAIHAAKFPAFA